MISRHIGLKAIQCYEICQHLFVMFIANYKTTKHKAENTKLTKI